ncbi:MAG TPA: helix-turn-helix domain-containing protein [Halanaerobiales bacterium]|nr:helix-turn-helix domain-containing protein [Halanaerobiales bacterium]
METKNDIFENLIRETSNKYPISLKVRDIIELTGYSQATVYRMLECEEIPGAKKIRGWRVPRDVFLAWWMADGIGDNEII